jgi:hypothetical protein
MNLPSRKEIELSEAADTPHNQIESNTAIEAIEVDSEAQKMC